LANASEKSSAAPVLAVDAWWLSDRAHHGARMIVAYLYTTWRRYHEQFVASKLPVTESTIGLIPAYERSRIAVDASNWLHYALSFNDVSDRPRNPANQADKNELAAMKWFRANPKATEHVAVISTAEGDVHNFTAPIWVEPCCLSRHGEPLMHKC
jgi:Protein of unknown function (DUF3365)